MKTIITTVMILLISAMALSAQKKYSKEEQTIIDLIQLHYDLWKNRSYEKWTELWVHEDYVGHTSVGPNYYFDRKGWDEVSEAQKNSIRNNAASRPDVDFSKFDYTIVIGDNLAIAKFIGESGFRTTSVFEKVNGTWKYILNEQINKNMYDLNSVLGRLGNFEGNWQLIPGSFKWENSQNQGEIISYDMSISQTFNGLNISTEFNFRNAQQVIWNGAEKMSVIKDSPSGKLIHTSSIYFSNNGWTNNSTGKTEVTDQTIELNGARIDDEKITFNYVIKKESTNQINVSSTDGSGAKWSVDMKLTE